nr:uncharacterized protein LOC108171446 [Malus domestica]
MDSKFALICFLLSSILFVTSQAVQPYEQTSQPEQSGINMGKVSSVLSDKGYQAMALTLGTILEAVIFPTLNLNHSTSLTLFCPKDQAFFNSKYGQPPLTLFKYHVVPFKMDKDSVEASFDHGSKVDTLLLDRPLVLTSLPTGTGGYASLNLVKVTEWDVYNDGRLIVIEIENFFDPAFQTLRYPQYDVMNVKDGTSQGFLGLKGALGIISRFLFLQN